jgi:hypothetical protein
MNSPPVILVHGIWDSAKRLEPLARGLMYTRFDLMILPAQSSLLRAARSTHELGVPMHRMMISDRRVFDLVARALQQPQARAQ